MIIYDFGANNGQNFNYYLSKGFKTIGIEANPLLCAEIEKKFSKEIASGQLKIINCCLSATSDDEIVIFYVHKTNSLLSQFNKPGYDKLDDFEPINIKSKKASTIIKEYGDPYYIKIDIEFYDIMILKELISNNIYAKYLSIESQSSDILNVLLQSDYKYFNAVFGWTMKKFYPNFDFHMAGPFGEDIKSPWLVKENLSKLFSIIKFGWIDIHATTLDINTSEIDLSFYKRDKAPLSLKEIKRKTIVFSRDILLKLMPSGLFKLIRKFYKKLAPQKTKKR